MLVAGLLPAGSLNCLRRIGAWQRGRFDHGFRWDGFRIGSWRGPKGGLARLTRFINVNWKPPYSTPTRLPLALFAIADDLFRLRRAGLTAIATSFWVKETLTLKPADLASLAVWLSLPWTMKMVFGQLVDSVPISARSAASTFSSARALSLPAC